MGAKKIEQGVGRYDVRKFGKATKLDTGFLRAPVRATRTGVFTYRRSDGSILREYRPPEEVFDQQSLDSLAGVILTNRHPAQLVNSKNAKKFTVGHVSDNVEVELQKFVSTSLTITDQKMIDEVEQDGISEVSCGYRCDLEFTSGVTEDGEEYDAIQRNIRYNHLAIVDRGRAGPEVKIKLDADDLTGAVCEDDLETKTKPKGSNKPNPKEDVMAKVTLGGVEFDNVDAGLANAITSELEKTKVKAEEDGKKAKQDAIDAAVKETTDTLQAKIDGLNEDLKKAKEDKVDEKDIHAKVVARAALMDSARKHLPEGTKFDDMSDLDIKKAVVEAKCDGVDLSEKSEAYIEGRFDHILTSKEETKTDAKLRTALKNTITNTDGDDEVDAEKARQDSMNYDQNAWQRNVSDYGKPEQTKH